jgi:hypothetical protein
VLDDGLHQQLHLTVACRPSSRHNSHANHEDTTHINDINNNNEMVTVIGRLTLSMQSFADQKQHSKWWSLQPPTSTQHHARDIITSSNGNVHSIMSRIMSCTLRTDI